MPYLAPSSTEDALRLLQSGQHRIIAGCTDYYPALPEGQDDPAIVDITGISALRGITRDGAGWRIGAATTWTDILRADLPPAFDALKRAAREVGSVQIQNRGTIAGNLCNASPAADGVPPLLALDAVVTLASATGSRQMPLRDFITGVRQTALAQGEMMTAVHIPATPDTARSGFVKLGSRTHLVISIAMVAAVIDTAAGRIARARIAVGSCAPVARRLPALETALAGLDAAGLAAADLDQPAFYAPLAPISDIRGSLGYRHDVVPALCKRAVLQAMGEG